MLYAMEMNELLKHFTYKPGWHFEALNLLASETTIFMEISFITEDTFNPGEQVKVGFREAIRPQRDEHQFWHTLLALCDKAERHETREWFKIDGVMPFNPHGRVS